MALTGIEIYKFLPKTNCKKCDFPTCLAFAMKVAQKTVDITTCPDLSDESRQALESAGRPPIKLVSIGTEGKKLEMGNEVVMFRHEKTFYHPTGVMRRIKDLSPAETVAQQVAEVTQFKVDRVGIELSLDGFAIDNDSGDGAAFAKCVEAVTAKTDLPLVLMSSKPEAMAAALEKAATSRPLIYAATGDNWEPMAELASKHGCPLAVAEPKGLSELAALVEEVNKKGVEDIVLDPGARDLGSSLNTLTQLRRMALKKNFQPLGYPIITFPGANAASVDEEAVLASQQVAKYASVIVLDNFSPALAYPLLTLRLNIYTDPQKPIQVQPGIYPIGAPKESSPLCVTTNFSLTYFSVAGELEGSGHAAWLLVCDTEGLSVLTAWAAGKFDAEKIAKNFKEFEVGSKIGHQRVIIPGRVAVLKGEIEEELAGWDVMVGPPDAMDIGGYLKNNW